MIKQTDIRIDKGIWVSRDVVYNDNKRRTGVVVSRVVYRAFNEYKKLLKVPKDVQVRICSLRKVNGDYDYDSKIIRISHKLPWDGCLEVLAHEMVHAEQFHTGRLKQKYKPSKGIQHYWNGKLTKNKGTTFNSYKNLPWEQEAFSRQKELADQVLEIIETKYEES